MLDKFGRFHISYEVEGEHTAINATVWEVAEWAADGTPIFYNAGPTAPVTDVTMVKPLFTLLVKWDGCSHMRMPYLHFDDLDELDALRKCIDYIYNDICDRHNVLDTPL